MAGKLAGALVLSVAALALFAACGSDDSDSPEGYVSITEAEFYFEGYYGGSWRCEGHGPPDHEEALVDPALMESVVDAGRRAELLPFRFVSCRLLSGGRKQVREDGIGPGSVLTFGIP